MTDRETMQQALEAMETNKYTVAELAPHKVVMKFNDAITALRTALAQVHAMHELSRLGQEIEQEPVAIDWQRGSVPLGGNSCSVVSRETIPFEFRQPAAQPEPTPWRDMVVTTLVREGINKHKARELADHFAAQQKQEPVKS